MATNVTVVAGALAAIVALGVLVGHYHGSPKLLGWHVVAAAIAGGLTLAFDGLTEATVTTALLGILLSASLPGVALGTAARALMHRRGS